MTTHDGDDFDGRRYDSAGGYEDGAYVWQRPFTPNAQLARELLSEHGRDPEPLRTSARHVFLSQTSAPAHVLHPEILRLRSCVGRAPDVTYCQSGWAYVCERCSHGVEEDCAEWHWLTSRPVCANGCNWHRCSSESDGVHCDEAPTYLCLRISWSDLPYYYDDTDEEWYSPNSCEVSS